MIFSSDPRSRVSISSNTIVGFISTYNLLDDAGKEAFLNHKLVVIADLNNDIHGRP